jgi:nickel-dependent lactate racemase
MASKDVIVDFGAEQATIRVPDNAVVARYADPDYLKQPKQALDAALAKPFAAPPFAALIKPGMSVAIAFDDPTRPPAPWQLILPELVARLVAGGVRREDITFICANGTHKKWTRDELRNFVGADLFDAFWPNGQIRNHDCLDAADLIDLGSTASGCAVEHNRTFINADLMIYVGQVMAHSWGGYTGTGAVIGLASTRSILSHHNHGVVNHPETTTGDHKRMYFRKLKAEINAHLEQATAKRIFYINWVGGVAGQMTDIVAGYSPEVETPAWDAADVHSRVSVPQADILVVGMPASFAYGSANNPLIAAIGMAYPPRVWLGQHVLREGGVVIGLHPSDGTIDPETYPSYREVIDLYNQHHSIHELARYQDNISGRADYLAKYRDGHAFHPIHPFFLLYSCDYVLSRASAVILAGTRNPGAFRQLGITPTSDFEQAWAIATRIVGPTPTTVVAPSYWSRRPFKFDVTKE